MGWPGEDCAIRGHQYAITATGKDANGNYRVYTCLRCGASYTEYY